jgi:hypothetical protein
MVGGRTLLKGALLLVTGSAAAPAAEASAWALAEGVQQTFATVSRETGDFGQSWRADDYTELGLGEGWGLNAKFETNIRINDIYDDRSGFRVGVLKAFALGDRGSISVQASFLGGESLDGVECEGQGWEARAAVGTSFSFAGREGYVNLEAGRRFRGDCERGVIEAATGLEFAPTWSLDLKAWQDGVSSTGSAKAEVAISHNFGPVAVGVGWREEISGNFEEKGWLLTARGQF